jgi:hypothetical protein
MISVTSTYLDSLPGESFLTKSLQYPIKVTLGKKLIKQGRLIIFKQVHYYIQITILNSKNTKEVFEIPIPFRVEEYPLENLIYFDYRIKSLAGKNKDLEDQLTNFKIKNTSPSQYYDKILEIRTVV